MKNIASKLTRNYIILLLFVISFFGALITLNRNNEFSTVSYAKIFNAPGDYDTRLQSLSINKGTLNQPFSSDVYEYNLTLAADDFRIEISATTISSDAPLIGTGTFDIPAGTSSKQLAITANDGSTVLYVINITRPASSYEYLAGISIAGIDIPDFDPETLFYEFTLPHDANIPINNLATIAVAKGRPSQSLFGTGPSTINFGTTTKKIIVTSEDGSASRTYTIDVTREHNTFLKTLEISGYSLNETFDPTRLTYTATIPNNVTEISLNATVSDGLSSFAVEKRNFMITGSNIVTITVTQPDVNPTVYTIDVTRTPGDLESNPYLSSLSVSPGTIIFEQDIFDYYLELSNRQNRLMIDAIAESSLSTVVISDFADGGVDVPIGVHTFNISVTAEDGSIFLYTITTTRSEAEEQFLDMIKIGDMNVPNFNPEVFNYEITLPYYFDDEDIVINATKQKAEQIVVGDGLINVPIGTTAYTVVVKSANELSSNTYTLNITREESTLLRSLSVAGFNLTPTFNSEVFNYEINAPSTLRTADITAIAYSSTAEITIDTRPILLMGDNTVRILVKGSNDETEYFININVEPITVSHTFTNAGATGINGPNQTQLNNSYNGTALAGLVTSVSGIQKWIVPYSGYYNFGVFGARGGTVSCSGRTGGYGAKVGGKVYLNQNEVLYILVGQMGYNKACSDYGGGGGGATFVAVENPNSADTLVPASKKVTLLFAAGGGGGSGDDGVNYHGGDANSATTGSGGSGTNSGSVTAGAGYKNNANTGSAKSFLNGGAGSNHSYPGGFGGGGQPYNGGGGGGGYTGGNAFDSSQSLGGSSYIISTATDQQRENRANYNHGYVTIMAPLTNNGYLSELNISDGTLDTTFNPNIFAYNLGLTANQSKITINAIPEDTGAIVLGNGTYDIPVGENTIEIYITAADGSLFTYYITTNREASSYKYLDDIKVAGTSIQGFSPTNLNYTVTVPYSVDMNNVEISGTVARPSQIVTGFDEISLDFGGNTHYVTVTSEDGSDSETYTLTLIREHNTYLSSLSVSGYSLNVAFNPETLTYSATIPATISNISVNATAYDPTATVTIDKRNFMVTGLNTVIVTVTEPNSTPTEYIINVTRTAGTQNSNPYLSSLTINPGVFNETFNSDRLNYSVDLDPDEAYLTIAATSEASTTSITGTGLVTVPSGIHVFDIVVQAQDGTTFTYKITTTRGQSDYAYLQDIKVNNISVEDFNPLTLDYTFNVDYNVESVVIEGIANHPEQYISGNVTSTVNPGPNHFNIAVTSESGGDITLYSVNVIREYSTKLRDLTVSGYDLSPVFATETYEYTISVPQSVLSVSISGITWDANATYTVSRPPKLSMGPNVHTVTVNNLNAEPTEYKITVVREATSSSFSQAYKFTNAGATGAYGPSQAQLNSAYSGGSLAGLVTSVSGIQKWIVPRSGNYKFNVYGARGGIVTGRTAGYGAMVGGTVYLEKDQVLYILVGQTGTDKSSSDYGGGGGGGTYIAVENPNSADTLVPAGKKVTLLFAAGAGGGTGDNGIAQNGGDATSATTGTGLGGVGSGSPGGGAGYRGNDNNNYSQSFLNGGKGSTVHSSYQGGFGGGGRPYDAGGAGAGYTGGGVASNSSMAYGGSSYIIETAKEQERVNKANYGHGYVEISIELSGDSFLHSLSPSIGSLSPEFDSETIQYTLNLSSEESIVSFAGTHHERSIVTGLDEIISVEPGVSNLHTIIVTAEDGSVNMYEIYINRPASTYKYLEDIKINGESITSFNPTQLEYEIELPYTTQMLDISAIKGRPGQIVTGEGVTIPQNGTLNYYLEVTPEDGSASVTYILKITKPHNTRLRTLAIEGFDFDVPFDPEVFEYNILSYDNVSTINITAATYDLGATYTINKRTYIVTGENIIRVVVTEPNSAPTEYVINFTIYSGERESYNFTNAGASGANGPSQAQINTAYTGTSLEGLVTSVSGIQKWVVPKTGTYLINAYGARGGIVTGRTAGYGAMVGGSLFLEKDQVLYILVGQRGYDKGRSDWGGGGGGATYIARVNTASPDTLVPAGQKVELLFAAGAGGGTGDDGINYNGGDATSATTGTGLGGTGGSSPHPGAGYKGNGGTGSAKSFLNGGTGSTGTYAGGFGGGGYPYNGGGGGGGYTGGNMPADNGMAYGGSSYIISSAENQQRIDRANYDHGYATLLLEQVPSNNAYLSSLTVNPGVLSVPFNSDTFEYNLNLTSEQSQISISATPEDSGSSVVGQGIFDVPVGAHTFNVTVTSSAGNTITYTIRTNRQASPNVKLNDLKINGTTVAGFHPDTLNYSITTSYTTEDLVITAEKARPGQTITGTGTIALDPGINIYYVNVTSEDGLQTASYELIVNRPHNTRLKTLSVVGHSFDVAFNPEVFAYSLTVPNEVTSVDVIASTYDPGATYTVNKRTTLPTGTSLIRVRVTEPNSSPTEYVISVNRLTQDVSLGFGYTGNYQTFIAPFSSTYHIELWGAASTGNNAHGGYTSGYIDLRAGEEIFIYVGGNTSNFNGGAMSGRSGVYSGGATDVRLSSGTWNDINSLRSRIMVAGGGGSYGAGSRPGGYGGGLNGQSRGESYGSGGGGGTQTNGGSGDGNSTGAANAGKFGIGGYGIARSSGYGGAGGGGYYGGGGVGPDGSGDDDRGGGGGSSFISGHAGSVALANDSSETPKTVGTALEKSIHYSERFFTNTTMIDGSGKSWTTAQSSAQQMPNPDGGFFPANSGKTGTGYARITGAAVPSNVYLSTLVVNPGELDTEFDMDINDYYVYLEREETRISIAATPEDPTTSVTGVGSFDVPAGTTEFSVVVTAANGDTNIYIIHVSRPASPYKYLSDLTINGETIPGFEPTELNYTVNLDYEVPTSTVIGGTKGRPSQEVVGFDTVDIINGTSVHTIEVTPEDGSLPLVYTITFNKEHSGLLRSLNIDNGLLEPAFDKNIFNYTVEVPNSMLSVVTTAIAYDTTATVTITGGGYLRPGVNRITISVSVPGEEKDTTYVVLITRRPYQEYYEQHYPYTGDVQTFIAPYTGNFQIELWGAQGAGRYGGASGGYTSGEIYLLKDTALYLYVGQSNSAARSVSWNGGGAGGNDTGSSAPGEIGSNGGGATDVRTSNFAWNDSVGLRDRIMVAAGGGGAGYSGNNGYAAGGLNGYGIGTISSQSAGSFGIGSAGKANIAWSGSDYIGGGGAGGGYYAGLTNSQVKSTPGGNGGSSFISGHIGSVALASSDSLAQNTNSDLLIRSTHYSGYRFVNTKMIDGLGYEWTVSKGAQSPMPNPSGGYYALGSGRTGDGYAVIKSLEPLSADGTLEMITVNPGELNEEFDIEIFDYTVDLGPEETSLTIEAITNDPYATVTGSGTFEVPAGTTVFDIFITAQNGETTMYTVTATRSLSSNDIPANIAITGLTESLCELDETYCNLEPEFDPATKTYSLTVPNQISYVNFEVTPGHAYQTFTGDGRFDLAVDDNVNLVIITSEDGQNSETYLFNIRRDIAVSNNLESLEIYDPYIEIDFRPTTTEYFVTLPYDFDSFTVIATPEDENATVTVEGNDYFDVGMSEVRIVVTSIKGTQKTYIIHVNRLASDNTYLRSLTVTSEEDEEVTNYTLSPKFNRGIRNYTLTVPYYINELTIDGVLDADTSTVFDGDFGIKELRSGNNRFTITVTAGNGEVGIYEINIFKPLNDNARLEMLSAEEGNLSPEFESGVFDYTMTVEPSVTSLTLTVTPEDSGASYTVTGNTNFALGNNNVVTVTVLAEDGSTYLSYRVRVNRLQSTNNNLRNLTNNIGDFDQDFDADVLDYTMTVPNEVTSITISAPPEDFTAVVSGAGVHYLTVGDNEISIKVRAESGDIKIYNITITRLASTNANLLDIINNVGGILTPAFDKDKTSYVINVAHPITNIRFTVVREDLTSTVSGDTLYNLNTGDNDIYITVTAEDGTTTKTYHINVVRDKSTDVNLKDLFIYESALIPGFNPMIILYDLMLPNEYTSLTIDAETEYPDATYEIIGNSNFVVGDNEVIVRVIAEAGPEYTKDYKIKVIRQPAELYSNHLDSLTTNKGQLIPDFDTYTYVYDISVPNIDSSINISATAEDNQAVISGTGIKPLNLGMNILPVTVTSRDGIIRTYQLRVFREKSSDARLKNLIITNDSLNQTFNRDIYNYSVNTTNTSLNLTAETLENEATYEIIGNENFAVGNNEVRIRVTAADGHTTLDYVINVNKLASNNNNLSWLTPSVGTLSPAFNKAIVLYTIDVANDVNNIVLTGGVEDENATVEGLRSHDLNVGINDILVIVTSQSGNEKTYTIRVRKAGSDNNFLKSITTSAGDLEPEFNKLTNEYNVEVEYDVTSISITGTPEHDGASVVGVNSHILNVGETSIDILVTSESGILNVYTVKVTRKPIISPLLSHLGINEAAITFSPSVEEYTFNVPNEITSLALDIQTLDPLATYTVSGNSNFGIGMNTVEIEVTASAGVTKKTYRLNVNRQLSSNNFLEYITLSAGSLNPTFLKTTMNYAVTVPNNIGSITIEGEAESETSFVTGFGSHILNTGPNTINIVVTSATGVERTYRITVTRLKSNNNLLNSLVVKDGTNTLPLSPAFNSNTKEYTVTGREGLTNIEIIATKANSLASVVGEGIQPVQVGPNTYDVIVTAEDGTTNTYTITLTRPASSNNYLTDIIPSIGVLEPAFDYYETDYVVNLNNSASLIGFAVSTENLFASVSGHEVDVLVDGPNYRTITVTAENNEIRLYNITVNKKRNDEARLSALSISGFQLDTQFNSNTYVYNITVPNSKKTITPAEITAIAMDANATVNKSATLSLVTNVVNQYRIQVVAQDGFTTQDYTINVTREKGTDASLSALSIAGYPLEQVFNSNVLNYTVRMPITKQELTANEVTATPTDENASVVKMNVLSLIGEGSKIYTITVTSDDGLVTRVYRVTVLKLLSSNNLLETLRIDNGTLNPAFNKLTNEYDLSLPQNVTDVTFFAEAEDTNAIILGNGYVEFKDGGEIVFHEISVTAEDGAVNVYTIRIIKNVTTSTLLENIEITGLVSEYCDTNEEYCNLTPVFDPEHNSYYMLVPYEFNSVGFLATPGEIGQMIQGTENLDLSTGVNLRTITVTNGIGQTNEYNFIIERDEPGNNFIADLFMTSPARNIGFTKNTFEYTVTVDPDVSLVTFNITLDDPENATYEIINADNLQTGNNDVIIRVRAGNGQTRDYVIHVNKQADGTSYLTDIIIRNNDNIFSLSPEFGYLTKSYTVNVPNEINYVDIEVTPESENAIVDAPTFKVLNPGSNMVTITVTSAGGGIEIYRVNIIRAKSSNANLLAFNINGYTTNEPFDSDTVNYTLDVPGNVTNIDLNPTKEENTSTYTISGNKNLKVGENQIKVTVIAEDGTTMKVYTITVTREASANNYLASLSTNRGELSPVFNELENDYTLTVDSSISNITISATKADENAILTGVGTYSLIKGENTINVTVKAQNGDENTYTIIVTRETSSNNYLFDIVNNRATLGPTFDSERTSYTINVAYEVTNITISGIKADVFASVSGNGTYNLSTGNNPVTLTVTAEDGTPREYHINVIRDKNTNANLKSLFVFEGVLAPAFDPMVVSYDLKVPNEITELSIEALTLDPNATYEIIDNENLNVGDNDVIIRVTAEAGEAYTKDYTIHVIRQEAETYSNYLTDLSIDKGELSPEFNQFTYFYEVSLPYSDATINISAVRESPDAKVTGTGLNILNLGENYLPVVVTSKDGIERTYTIKVVRAKSNDARLRTLLFNEGNLNPTFNRDTENYTINVGSSTSKLTGTIEPLEVEATYEMIGNQDFTTGDNVVTITVTAPDGTTQKTYTITVKKAASANNFLKSLTNSIGSFDKPFNKNDNGPYTINVDNDVYSINLEGLAEDENAEVTGLGTHSLNVGINNIKVVVKSEAGTTKTYTILVIKSGNTNNYLSTLGISGVLLNETFLKTDNNYTATVPYEIDTITVNATAEDPNATVTGNTTHSLNVGETEINVVVTSESGAINTYVIKVTREKIVSARLLSLSASEGTIIPDFNPNLGEYDIFVPNEVTSLTLDIIKEDEEATYEIFDNSNFQTGLNVVTIVVTDSQNNNTKTYKLNVTRLETSNNFLSSLEVSEGTLSPAFDELTLLYSVTVGTNINEITITGTLDDETASVTGLKTHELNIGLNTLYVVVTSNTGIERTYTIKVTREESGNNLLENLSLSADGVDIPFDQPFNSSTKTYTVTLPSGIDTVTIAATPADENAEVAGTGNYLIGLGTITKQITVTAANGEVEHYEIIITRNPSTNTNLTSLIPSIGELSPEFDNATDEYEINVGMDEVIIDFTVITEDENATVSGNGITNLVAGPNLIPITITAEDGSTTRTINITVNKSIPLEDIIVDKDHLIMQIGDIEIMNLEFIPAGTTNTNVTWESEDSSVATVIDGTITASGMGTTNIKVTSVENPSIVKYILVEVINLTLENDNYDIVRISTEEELPDYIIGIPENLTIAEYLGEFNNRLEDLRIYNANDNEISDTSGYIGTGMIIKLEVGEDIYDELRVVVRGDITGDGIVNALDLASLDNNVLKTQEFSQIQDLAADLVSDKVINALDLAKLDNYILKSIPSIND